MMTELYSGYGNRPVVLPEGSPRESRIDADLARLGEALEVEVWAELDALARNDMPDRYCAFALCRPRTDPVEVYLRPVGKAMMVVSVDRGRPDHRAMFHGMGPGRDAIVAAEALVRQDLGLVNETLEERPWMRRT